MKTWKKRLSELKEAWHLAGLLLRSVKEADAAIKELYERDRDRLS